MKHSSIVRGTLSHTRKGNQKNSFQYSHTMLLIDLKKMKEVRHLPWPLQYNQKGMIAIRDRDYLDDESKHMYDNLLPIVSNSSSRIVAGDRVLLLATPSVLGYCFNPAIFYFIYDTNDGIKSVVVEVHNTFGESHLYCLSKETLISEQNSHRAQKEFHVSPFLDRSGHYEFIFNLTESVADISIFLYQEEHQIMTSRFVGELISLTTSNLLKSLPSIGVSVLLTKLRILHQAYRLFLKRKTSFFEKSDPLKATTRSPSKGYIDLKSHSHRHVVPDEYLLQSK